MKHNCYTCALSPDRRAPFKCPYVTWRDYSAVMTKYRETDVCEYVYPNSKDCDAWEISIPKLVKYVGDMVLPWFMSAVSATIIVSLAFSITFLIILMKMGV